MNRLLIERSIHNSHLELFVPLVVCLCVLFQVYVDWTKNNTAMSTSPSVSDTVVLIFQQRIKALEAKVQTAQSLANEAHEQLERERRLHQQTSDELLQAKQRLQQLDDDDVDLQLMVNTEAKENDRLRERIKALEASSFKTKIENQDLRSRLDYLQKTVVDPVLRAAHDAQQIQPMKE
jgi:hypothetical protein